MILKNNSQSFGKILFDTNYKQNDTAVFNFKWNYHNTYDDKSGNAKVKLEKIYQEGAILSKLSIITEKRDTIEYKGYMEGSIQ